jgi:NAD(P)-dependent dehydrogenase (short-subunit alcohol dehydrogenase family)
MSVRSRPLTAIVTGASSGIGLAVTRALLARVFLTGAEIADAVLHLADATYTTGVVLPVDGGMATGRW